ncbi:MAG TPA: NlpC/P60 family protein [Candidatus Eisenbacteria bacterium]
MNCRAAAAWVVAFSIAVAASACRTQAATAARPATDSLVAAPPDTGAHLRAIIESHLGRPYVWGSCGLKSFDCSGFVWRVMQENGILLKRTTARKYYLSLPKVSDQERWRFGNVVFFSNLKHCGIVEGREGFYHAAVSAGTHRSQFDPLWRQKISGVRAMPGLERRGAAHRSSD